MSTLRLLLIVVLSLGPAGIAGANDAINIGSRLELFTDGTLIDRLSGEARQELHHPVPQDPALVMDKPWEGNALNYVTVFQDGDVYRMYYRGENSLYTPTSYYESTQPTVTCYAESKDGIHWTKPSLGICDFKGSKKNNIVWQGEGTSDFAPFKDTNPGCKPEARYKALAAKEQKPNGLLAFQSPDGIHWSLLRTDPVITKGAFDSQNLAFWDALRSEYREYHRDFRDGGRDIRTGTSQDFLDWTDPVYLQYSPGRISQLYTNQVIPYYRAPHIYLAFPTRYTDRGWTSSAESLPRPEYRHLRGAKSQREGTAVTDGMFMSSRDGLHFTVWPESFLRPGLRTTDTWFYGDIYQNWGLVETASRIADSPREISVYFTESTMQDRPAYLRRYTLRVDGFVSLAAPLSGGEVLTKPLVFQGDRLMLNYSTSGAGSVRVEIQDAKGQALPGFSLGDCSELYGDSLEQAVVWKGNPALGKLAGQPLRLRFELRDADVYSMRFAEKR